MCLVSVCGAQVTQHCFLDNQEAIGHYGVYHFPLADTVVDKLPDGFIHWSDEAAAGCGVPTADYFVGCEEELCAEYIYELIIVSRGLAAVEGSGGGVLRAKL